MPEPDRPPRPPGSRQRAGGGTRRWLEPRVLAITGLVLAAVPCCPMTGLAGAFLGVFALRRIRLAGGDGRGRRLALAAIVVGAASAFVWSMALERFGTAMQDAQRDEVAAAITTALQAAQDDDLAALLEVWSTDSDPPRANEVTEFGRTALTRYGRLDRFAFISMAQSGSLFRAVIDVAGVGHFERGEPLVAARFEVRAAPGRLMPVVRLVRLTIEDEPRGDITLAPPATTEPPAPANP